MFPTSATLPKRPNPYPTELEQKKQKITEDLSFFSGSTLEQAIEKLELLLLFPQENLPEIMNQSIHFLNKLKPSDLAQRAHELCFQIFTTLNPFTLNFCAEKKTVSDYEVALLCSKVKMDFRHLKILTFEQYQLFFQLFAQNNYFAINSLTLEDLNEFSHAANTLDFRHLHNLNGTQTFPGNSKVEVIFSVLFFSWILRYQPTACQSPRTLETIIELFLNKILLLLEQHPNPDQNTARALIAIEDFFTPSHGPRAQKLGELKFYDHCQNIFSKHPPALEIKLSNQDILFLSHYQKERLLKVSTYFQNLPKTDTVSLESFSISPFILHLLLNILSGSKEFLPDELTYYDEFFPAANLLDWSNAYSSNKLTEPLSSSSDLIEIQISLLAAIAQLQIKTTPVKDSNYRNFSLSFMVNLSAQIAAEASATGGPIAHNLHHKFTELGILEFDGGALRTYLESCIKFCHKFSIEDEKPSS